MENKDRSIREWQEAFNRGEFDGADVDTQIKAGWFDWFCREQSLGRRLERMAKIVMRIKGAGKVDLDHQYVFFKNNCPMVGPLYDSFSICDRETGDVVLWVGIGDKRADHRYEVTGQATDFQKELFSSDSLRELVEWLNRPWEQSPELVPSYQI